VFFGSQDFFVLLSIAFGAAVVQGTLGFAFGMVAMALAALVIDVRTASILVSPLAFVNVSTTLWSVRRSIRWKLVLPVVGGTLVGIPFGLAILLGGNLILIRFLVSALLVYVGVTSLIGWKERRDALPGRVAAVAGLGVGVIGGATNIGGPPLVAYASRQPWDAETFKATLLTTFFVSSGTKSALLIANGAIDARMLACIAGLVPAIIAGSLIGVHLFNRINKERFKRIISWTLLVLAVLVQV